jgi:hypothetical protein
MACDMVELYDHEPFPPRERLFPSSFSLIDRRFGALCVMGSSGKRKKRYIVREEALSWRKASTNSPIFVVIALLLELRLVL